MSEPLEKMSIYECPLVLSKIKKNYFLFCFVERARKKRGEKTKSNRVCLLATLMHESKEKVTLEQVAAHYDEMVKRFRQPSTRRGDGPYDRVRYWNNQMKRTLIVQAWKRANNSVSARGLPLRQALDLCHGQGGDLTKFAATNVARLVAIDISAESLFEAAVRYESMKPPRFQYYQFQGDALRARPEAPLPAAGSCLLVSCQFALHYSTRLKQTLGNIALWLCRGGRFVTTVVDSRRLRATGTATGTGTSTDGANGTSTLHHIKLEEPHEDPTAPLPTGTPYRFTLGEHVRDLTEYVIDYHDLCRWARDCGLYLRWSHHIGSWARAQESRLSAPEFETLNLYVALEFEKV